MFDDKLGCEFEMFCYDCKDLDLWFVLFFDVSVLIDIFVKVVLFRGNDSYLCCFFLFVCRLLIFVFFIFV